MKRKENMTNIVKFNDKKLTTIEHNGKIWLSSKELAKGLGYADDHTVNRIYTRHADEFTEDMVGGVNLTPSGNLKSIVRVFSPRGCHLIAMFARTPFAKEFRKWVLDVLEKMQLPAQQEFNLRPLPYDLTQDKQALKVIGGMIKRCCASAIKETLTTDHAAAINAMGTLVDYISTQKAEQQANVLFHAWKSQIATDLKRLVA